VTRHHVHKYSDYQLIETTQPDDWTTVTDMLSITCLAHKWP